MLHNKKNKLLFSVMTFCLTLFCISGCDSKIKEEDKRSDLEPIIGKWSDSDQTSSKGPFTEGIVLEFYPDGKGVIKLISEDEVSKFSLTWKLLNNKVYQYVDESGRAYEGDLTYDFPKNIAFLTKYKENWVPIDARVYHVKYENYEPESSIVYVINDQLFEKESDTGWTFYRVKD